MTKKIIAQDRGGRPERLKLTAGDIAHYEIVRSVKVLTNAIQRNEFYWDAVHFWTKRPLRTHEIKAVRALGSVKTSRLIPKKYDETKFMRLPWRYRYELHQPNDAMFQLLDTMLGQDVLINYTENKIEFICEPETIQQLRKFIQMHLVQRHHGKQRQGAYAGTDYSKQKHGARNSWKSYRHPSKITGEMNCLGLEWITFQVSAVRARNIYRFSDLINYDHPGFWQKHLNFQYIDREKLQKWYVKNIQGKKGLRIPKQLRHADHLLTVASYNGLGKAGSNIEPHGMQAIIDGWSYLANYGIGKEVLKYCTGRIGGRNFLKINASEINAVRGFSAGVVIL